MPVRFVRRGGLRILLPLVFLALPEAVFAGKVRLADSSGGSATPTDGSTLQVSFNPTATATVQPQDSVASVLANLAAQINAVSAGVYIALVVDPMTLDIERTTGEEIDDLHFVENDRGVQSVTLSLSRTQRIAQIGEIQQAPTIGTLVVTLNDRRVVVETTGKGSAAAVNAALVQAIRAAEFQVDYVSPMIIISRDLRSGAGLTLLGLQSTDPGIFLSDLALVPAPAAAP